MIDQDSDALWFKDAVIYQVHVRAFSDKAARHPEQFGLRGLIQQNSGIK